MKSRTLSTLSASFLAASLLCASATAEIYKIVDKDGNVSYSDKSPEGAEKVELRSSNSVPGVATPAPAASDSSSEEEDKINYRLSIASPANDSAIEHGPGNFTVKVTIRPSLADKHRLQLYMDGAAYGPASGGTSFALTAVDRGTHTLQVKVIGAKGETLKTSRSSTVHVFRPSVLAPGYRR